MPLQEHMRIISVDDHLIEHPRVFSDRLPAKFLEQGPRIVEDEKGCPNRFVPLAILPIWDIDLAVAELRRVAAKGVRVVSFPDSPVPLGMPSFYSDYWGPLWDVFEETGVIRNRHEIGIDRLCVEIDYPHVDCNWPNSRKMLSESVLDVSDEDAHKMVELNARDALNFPSA